MKPELKLATINGRKYLVCSACGHTPARCGCADTPRDDDGSAGVAVESMTVDQLIRVLPLVAHGNELGEEGDDG